jgi:mRNA interferase RelE/StbE
MKYKIIIAEQAIKALGKLPRKVQRQISEKIDSLADNPRPAGTEKLQGADLYRIRSGDYRVIYQIKDDVLIVLVVRIGHRKDIYRNLS